MLVVRHLLTIMLTQSLNVTRGTSRLCLMTRRELVFVRTREKAAVLVVTSKGFVVLITISF